MLDELQVKCEAQDCGKVMQRGLLLAHLRSCSRAIVTCGDDQCGISVSAGTPGPGAAGAGGVAITIDRDAIAIAIR